MPKCAGSSVREAIIHSLPPGAVSPKVQPGLFWMVDWDPDALDPDWRKSMVIDDDEVQELAGYDVVIGHFPLPLLRRITAPSLVATVLREPRARVLSLYAFWRLAAEQPGWQGWSLADFASRPFDEFLDSPLVCGETDNLICRMLVDDDARIPLHGLIAPGDVSGVASRAIEALDSLGYVGLVELGDSMWQGLSAFFDANVTRMTVNTTDEWRSTSAAPGIDLAITPRTLELLEARTAADSLVFRHALAAAGYAADAERIADAAFANQLQRAGNSIGKSLNALRERAAENEELRQQLAARDAALRQAEEDLARHRAWLDGIQGSASWRLTAPVRAAKHRLLRIATDVRRPARG